MLKRELQRISENAKSGSVFEAVGREINVGGGVDVYLLVDISGSISEDLFNKTKRFLQSLISNVSICKRHIMRFM